MKRIIKEEQLVKIGKMKKDPFTMSADEKIQWRQELQKSIRSYLFSREQPLVYSKDGQLVEERKDGTIQSI
ncbi:hypothetical protein ACLCDV_13785 [Sphingobacterium sp. Lzh-3]|jgi:hypothetical protein|uniref:hypothetical protein n=1 Tax=Sphingobacterium TaxID=28453 RepID=UPI002953FA37|nr:hypothetical protein [Sphingobacterium sp. UGAL515B_05]WON93552.1 hypothetical protein OK025_20175 [Sphingobacterium sp. UGAL515B_05]